MTVKEKFNCVPCELLINIESSPFVWMYDQDCNLFFAEGKEDLERNIHCGFYPTPYYEKDSDLFWEIFWSLLDDDDLDYLNANYEGSYRDYPALREFLRNSQLYTKLYETKKLYPMYLLDSWEKRCGLDVDWYCAEYD